MKASYRQVAEKLSAVSRCVVLAHMNPDPDAYGSMCGLSLALKELGLTIVMVNENGAQERLAWIPGVKDVGTLLPEWSKEEMVVTCDCGAAERIGDTLKQLVLERTGELVNIDHHYSNTNFGTVNLVDETASSTSEMIFKIVRELEGVSGKKLMTPDVANALFAGIVGDTGSFRYASTSAETFAVAHQLVLAGASPANIGREMFARTPISALRLQSDALCKLELKDEGKYARTIVTQGMLKEFKAELTDSDVLVERLRDIDGVQISALLKEDVDFWRVSLRSKSSECDVSQIASSFGGGGHRAAAAFRFRRTLPELLTELDSKISTLLRSVTLHSVKTTE